MRRFQQESALEAGWVDASKQTTFNRFLKKCVPFVSMKTIPLSPAQELLLCRKVVRVARTHFKEGPLGNLTDSALVDLLQQLIFEVSVFPDATQTILDWFLQHSSNTKLGQLGVLLYIWRTTLKQEGWADRRDVQAAIIKILRGNREAWPPFLKEIKTVVFKSVRWLNPFEESCLMALDKKLKIKVEMALPPAHSEKMVDRLGMQVYSERMSVPWENWVEDLADALVLDAPDVVQFDNAERVLFSRSVGAYGEIEDLARRMAWKMEHEKVPAHQMALVVPNLSLVQDIVPHVFGRFNIPYYFRRGRPVLSSPLVKAFLAWLAFPLHLDRDRLVDLFRNPALRIKHREEEVNELLKRSPDLRYLPAGMVKKEGCTAQEALDVLHEKVVVPEEDHFNSTAVESLVVALESLGTQRIPLFDLLELLEKLLENETIRPRDSHDQGVWVINPHDAVGLSFDLVLFATLNEGEFPVVPQQDALLNNYEREQLCQTLQAKKYTLPGLFLPSTDLLMEQQHQLFLGAMGMARQEIVFSAQTMDPEGKEKSAGEYYRKLWQLAGWPAQEKIVLSTYDRWRLDAVGEDSVFVDYMTQQQAKNRNERLPMLGESFLSFIPIALCCATDEALQSAMQKEGSCNPDDSTEKSRFDSLIKRVKIETERNLFLDTPIEQRIPSIYSGFLGSSQSAIQAWFDAQEALSPTALERLAHSRYLFFVEKVLHIHDPKIADDAPNPMDRGGLIHQILAEIYQAFLEETDRWAVLGESGWQLRSEGGKDAIPLVHFVAAQKKRYLEEAEKKSRALLTSNRGPMFGAPRVWEVEQEKIVQMVQNFVRYDVEHAEEERRYPALFEMHFEKETALDLGLVRVKGVVDRLDLIFEETGQLAKIRVLDYKGLSRSRSHADDYRNEICLNLDCQLPLYAFAAQQLFFGEFNTEKTNLLTDAGYLFYQREYAKVASLLKKSLISLAEPNLTERFFETLSQNIDALQRGDFSTDPLIASYNDYISLCRTLPVDPDELN